MLGAPRATATWTGHHTLAEPTNYRTATAFRSAGETV